MLKYVYNYIKDMKIIGMLKEDNEKKVMEVVVLFGVVVGLIFFINFIFIVIYKIFIFIKVGNSIVFFLYLNVLKVIFEIVRIISEVVEKVGCLKGVISCMIVLII